MMIYSSSCNNPFYPKINKFFTGQNITEYVKGSFIDKRISGSLKKNLSGLNLLQWLQVIQENLCLVDPLNTRMNSSNNTLRQRDRSPDKYIKNTQGVKNILYKIKNENVGASDGPNPWVTNT
ncbi:MAG: hypothetical protein ACP5L4_01900 [Thermoplasmata archaeon]